MTEVAFQPIGRRVQAKPGQTLLEAAQQAGVALSAVCGGAGICGDCRVRVQRGAVSALNDTEVDLITDADLDSGLRLACQTLIEDAGEIVVDVPAESLSAPQRSQVEGEEIPLAVAPVVAVHDVRVEPPSIHNLAGDWERLQGIVPADWHATAPVLAQLSGTVRAHDWQTRLIGRGREVAAFLPPDTAPFGFAVDVGTTGLAAYLVDLVTGETRGMKGATNPQIAYGEDVMARLTLAMREPEGRARLQASIIAGLNDLLRDVCAQAGVSREQVVDVVLVGNTAMHHLLLGLPVEQLGSAPYVPAVSAAVSTPAHALGLDVTEGAALYMPPNVAGFVGADHVSMLLATATAEQPGVTLSLDIGTNTEISLNANGTLWCCSTASGPAFEGAHIRDGMRAADGAIERLIWQDGALRWMTINHAPPVGLCGSGILDAVAVLRAADILRPTGAMRRDRPGVHAEQVNPWYEIVPATQSGHGREVAMSRADVNEVQLAKAAIRAGIKLLVERAGLDEADIDRVIVAGAFGNYIDLENAIAIGMFPPLPLERFHQVGNAAGIGAKRLLINAQERQRAAGIAARLNYIELTNHPDFTDRFSQAVLLTPDPWE
ncbi:ASKHA domain-containing protein [Aggregatilinea lenta]|uniref:ASKHA domain-containing protein n=1 Tax=Aggregatilinea lenta TaxID=913108 RepID=UPI000E5B2AAB|nr:ASKHA domain-containing protein [Aggregatilinea lenta]